MSIARKARLAAEVLRNDGLAHFVRRAKTNISAFFSAQPHVDECEVVFGVLTQQSPHGVMLDVGAHFGAALDSPARAGWRVIAFEPDPRNRAKLKAIYGKFPNVTADCRGLSDVAAEGVPFYSSESSSGISGLHAFDETHQETARVELTTLSAVIDEYNLTEITFLKIDAEGFDLPIIKGLPDGVLPEAIVCEFEDSKTQPLGYSYSDMGNYLKDLGYQVLLSEWEPIQEYGTRHRWRRAVEWPATLRDGQAWGNFIAMRNAESMARVIAALNASNGANAV